MSTRVPSTSRTAIAECSSPSPCPAPGAADSCTGGSARCGTIGRCPPRPARADGGLPRLRLGAADLRPDRPAPPGAPPPRAPACSRRRCAACARSPAPTPAPRRPSRSPTPPTTPSTPCPTTPAATAAAVARLAGALGAPTGTAVPRAPRSGGRRSPMWPPTSTSSTCPRWSRRGRAGCTRTGARRGPGRRRNETSDVPRSTTVCA